MSSQTTDRGESAWRQIKWSAKVSSLCLVIWEPMRIPKLTGWDWLSHGSRSSAKSLKRSKRAWGRASPIEEVLRSLNWVFRKGTHPVSRKTTTIIVSCQRTPRTTSSKSAAALARLAAGWFQTEDPSPRKLQQSSVKLRILRDLKQRPIPKSTRSMAKYLTLNPLHPQWCCRNRKIFLRLQNRWADKSPSTQPGD